jgi:plastocyanin
MRRQLARALPGTLAVLLVGSLPTFAADHFVTVGVSTFSPKNLTIIKGDTVHWTVVDEFGFHTVTSGNPCTSNGTFNSGALGDGGTFQFTFASIGSFNYFCAFHCLSGMTGSIAVEDPPVGVETPLAGATLEQNFPNPFNPSTTIEFSLPAEMRAVVAIYTTDGELVARLDDGVRGAGKHRVQWDGRDASGQAVGSGIYFYRLEGAAGVAPRKMVLLK